MAKRLNSVLGIDIGSHSIKVCEVKTSGKGAMVSAIGVVPTPEGSVDHSGVYNPEAVGAALKQALAFAGASTSMAVVSVAGQQSVLVRVLDVPRMEAGKELEQHMEWEINKNIPFAETTIQSDYKILPSSDPNSPEMEVVMAMSPQSAIDTLVECIKKSGRKPFAIDVAPLSVVRSLSISMPETQMADGVCIVDIGHLSTQINLYNGNKLVLPRPVPGGSQHVTQAIADSMGIGAEEAEEYKKNRFSVPSTATGGYGGGFDDFSQTQAFVPVFDSGTSGVYQDTGPGAYDPSATVGFTPEPAIGDLAIDPITGLPITAPAGMDDLAINPVTGLPMEPAQPILDAATDAYSAPTYANDPFAVAGDSVPDAFAPVGNETQTFDANWGVDPVAPAIDAGWDAGNATMSMPAPIMVNGGGDDPAFGSVSPVLEELVAEIRRSIDYYSGKGGSVSRIVLCGGGSRLKGLDGYISRSLGVSCERLDPFRNINFTPKKVGMDYVNEHREQLTGAIGNGLHILFE